MLERHNMLSKQCSKIRIKIWWYPPRRFLHYSCLQSPLVTSKSAHCFCALISNFTMLLSKQGDAGPVLSCASVAAAFLYISAVSLHKGRVQLMLPQSSWNDALQSWFTVKLSSLPCEFSIAARSLRSILLCLLQGASCCRKVKSTHETMHAVITHHGTSS